MTVLIIRRKTVKLEKWSFQSPATRQWCSLLTATLNAWRVQYPRSFPTIQERNSFLLNRNLFYPYFCSGKNTKGHLVICSSDCIFHSIRTTIISSLGPSFTGTMARWFLEKVTGRLKGDQFILLLLLSKEQGLSCKKSALVKVLLMTPQFLSRLSLVKQSVSTLETIPFVPVSQPHTVCASVRLFLG